MAMQLEGVSCEQILITVGLVSAVAWAWAVLNWVWVRPRRLERCLRSQGFSGNPYRFFYGDLNDDSDARSSLSKPFSLSHDISSRLIPFFQQSVKHYGKNSFTWIGPVPQVNIIEPELIREALAKFNSFQKPTPNPLTKLLVTGLPRYEGDKWAKHRRIVNPAFHQEKLKNMVPGFYMSCSEMVSKWEKMVAEHEEGGTCELDVKPYIDNLTADVISRNAFGSSYEEGKMIFELQKEQAKHAFHVLKSVYIPGWRFLPTKTNRRMKQIEKQVNGLLRGIIDKKLKAMNVGGSATDDLLGILLESNIKGINQEGIPKVELSMKDVIEECKVFYLAGQDTTSSLLAWTMVLLSHHQNWQSRAREEVLQVFGNNQSPDMSGLNRLKVVTMILYEVLRLYPPLVTLIRVTREDTTLGKLRLPSGVQLSLSTLLVHHDQETWGDDAKEFKPERFSEGVSKAAKHHQLSFFSFSWGPRVCIGQNFAMIEAKMAVAMILQRFSFELSPSYSHAPFIGVSLQPQHGVPLILRKL